MLRVHLFGRPRLLIHDLALPIAARPKVVPLLAYLLLNRHAPLARSTVAAALWPDDSETDGRTNLRRHLHYLTGLLPPGPGAGWIRGGGGTLRWIGSPDSTIDVAEFERLAALPNRAEDAVALYDGHLLAGYDEEWLEAPRERLRARYHEVLVSAIAAARARRDFGAAMSAATQLLRDDPWREDVLRQLMHVHDERGDRAGALAEYERFREVLRAELDAEPMAETRAIYRAIADDTFAVEPPIVPGPRDPPPCDALPFVGREYELAQLHERFERAGLGAGGIILIGGESGAGKSRLAREFAARCEARGALVYQATTTLPEYAPYAPLADLLRQAAPLAANLAIDPLWLGAVTPLVAEIGAYVTGLPLLEAVDPARERVRLFEACADIWSAMASRRPVVLVLDDVHWAGAGTIALLDHLAHRAEQARIVLVATYREDELAAGHPFRALRRRVERDNVGLHIALPRLGEDDVVELLRGSIGDSELRAQAHAVFQASEGNAFFADAIVREMRERGAAAGIPLAVRDLISERVARMSESARALADFAAVIGRAFDAELLQDVSGWPQAELLDAVGELIDRRIIADRGGNRFDYAFTHHLFANCVYDALADPVRVRRHRRIAQVLERNALTQRLDAAELGRHWECAGESERAAQAYLAAARYALSVFAGEDASEHVARVVALSGDRDTIFGALLLRESILSAAGDREAQAGDLDELWSIARMLDRDARCTVLLRRIAFANLTSDRRREHVLIAILARTIRSSNDTRWTTSMLEARARYERAINDFGAARTTFAELIALAAQTGERDTHVTARLAVADTYIYEGRLDVAREMLEAVRSEVVESGNAAALIRTLMSFARAALVQQDYGVMSAFADEALTLARSIGDREGEALALHTIANGLVYTYRVDDARQSYIEALALYERMGHRVGLAGIFVDYGLFHTELGLLEPALQLYERAEIVACEIGFTLIRAVIAINTSYTKRLQTDYDGAKAAALVALTLSREIAAQHLEAAALGALGAAECALGEVDAAVAHLETGVALRRPAGPSARLGDNLCALARSYAAAGDARAATLAASEMLDLYRSNPKLAPQPADWLLAAAEVERIAGRPDKARAHIRHARSVVQARAAEIADSAERAAYLALPFNAAVTASLRIPS